MISTRNLDALPDIAALRRLTQSLAMLDAIMCRDWEGRYYSFISRWVQGEMMASMRNGQGDAWFLLFCQAGAIMKGFAHEAPMAIGSPWPGVLSDIPSVFGAFLAEPAFSLQDTTFCIWCMTGNRQWRIGAVEFPPGPDPDGSANLLSVLDGRPQTYQQWAEEYYEVPVDVRAVEHVYKHRRLTDKLVKQLNADTALEDLADDVAEIGYPSGTEHPAE